VKEATVHLSPHRTIRSLLLLASALLLAASCSPLAGEPLSATISGKVSVGAVSGARATAYALDDDARKGEKLGSADVSEDGTFIVNIGSHTGPTLVCAAGGSFLDDSTGVSVRFGSDELCALVENAALAQETTGVLITPLTSLDSALAGCFVRSGTDTSISDASKHAALRLNDFFAAGLADFDFRSGNPTDPAVARFEGLEADGWHGIVLAGLSEAARQISITSDLDEAVRVTETTLTAELVKDIDDGSCVFDGAGVGGVVLKQGRRQGRQRVFAARAAHREPSC